MTSWKRPLGLSILLCTATGVATAFEQCVHLPGHPTKPCATVGQGMWFLVVPAVAALAIVLLGTRRIRIRWLRYTAGSVIAVVTLAWELLALAAIDAFLAPCSGSCWY